MQDAVNFLEEDLKSYRVGKANPLIFNNVSVDYYGTPTPVSQVASITTPDAKTLAIQPWEKNMIPKIEKAIIDANLGFTPQNNGGEGFRRERQDSRTQRPQGRNRPAQEGPEERRTLRRRAEGGRGRDPEGHRQERKGRRRARRSQGEGHNDRIGPGDARAGAISP